MKCKNVVTGHIFEVSGDEGKQLLNEYDCFEIVDATDAEKKNLLKHDKVPSTIRQRVMKSERKAQTK